MAVVIPFPLVRRRDYVERQAERMANCRPCAAENILHHQLQVQRVSMLRKGIDPSRVEGQVLSLEKAVRSALNRISAMNGAEA